MRLPYLRACMAPRVDLVVNCWERSYRSVLAPRFFGRIAEQCRFPFAGRVALINNVDDEADARERAEALVADGELTGFAFVREHLGGALEQTGLDVSALGATRRYMEAVLVAVTLRGAPWLVYWDAEVTLADPVDWIRPSIELMERDGRVMCANPDNLHHPVSRERAELIDGFALAYGFSDQLFLARRRDFAGPVYGERCVASLRYPLAHLGRIFEMRVDSYMRHNGRLRASHLGSRYFHPPEMAGDSYPTGDLRARLRNALNMAIVAYLRKAPEGLRPRCARDLGHGV
jgi:hypothetical protein